MVLARALDNTKAGWSYIAEIKFKNIFRNASNKQILLTMCIVSD